MKDFPKIPEGEFVERRKSLQERMAKEGIDLLVVNSNDGATAGQANVRYLTDFAAHFEPTCCLLPRSGDCVLVTGPESEALARVYAKIERIVIAKEYAHPEEDYPWAKIMSLNSIIGDIANTQQKPIKKVGIVGQELIEMGVLKALSGKFEIAPAQHLMNEMRSIKSQNEIKVMQYTYEIAEAGLKAALKAIRDGVREVEVAAEAEYAMRQMGSEGTGIDTMVASGADLNRPIIARTTLKKIRPKELVLVTLIPKYQGYHAALGRPVSIGKPDHQIVEAVQLTQKAQEKIIENLNPGKLGRAVENEGRKVMAEKGLDRYFAYIGLHSVGLVEFEPPIFFSKSDEKIRENMILSVDVPCFLAPWGGFRLEDGFMITARGGTPLDSVQRGLVVLD